MRMTPRALRASIIAATATAAISVGAASGAMAATQHGSAAVSAVEAAAHTKTKRVYVKTVQLAAKGHTAKVYKIGRGTYQADILFHGKKVATVTAKGKIATANLNGLHVKLTPSGAITSWVDRAQPNKTKQQPKPGKPQTKTGKPQPKSNPQPTSKRQLVRVETLADGTVVKVYKLSANHFQAVVQGGAKLGTLDANGRSTTGENNGLHVLLNPDGSLSSWVDKAPTRTTPQAPAPETELAPEVKPAPEVTPAPEVKPAPEVTPAPEVKPAPEVTPAPEAKPAPEVTLAPSAQPSSPSDTHDPAAQ